MLTNKQTPSDEEFAKFVRHHSLYFDGSFHAAFLLLISFDRQEIFLVKHKHTENWMIPGGRIDMKGTGRKLLEDRDETPLQCALKEFEEETQQSAETVIKQRLVLPYSPDLVSPKNCDFRLRNIIEKTKKRYFDHESQKFVHVNWKCKIFYTVLDRFDAMMFEQKFIQQQNIETSECQWVSYNLIKQGKIQISNKAKKSITKIMEMVRSNHNCGM